MRALKILGGIALLSVTAITTFSRNVASYSKTPYEEILRAVDFSRYVGTDGLTLDTIAATNLDTGANTTSVIVGPDIEVNGAVVTYRLRGGLTGQTHIVSIHVIDNATGEKLDAEITLTIESATGR